MVLPKHIFYTGPRGTTMAALSTQSLFHFHSSTGRKLWKTESWNSGYAILFYIVLYCSILFYMVLYGSIWFYMVLYGSIWFYMVLYGSIWFYMVLYGSIWFYMVLYGSIWFYMVLYGSILFYIVLSGSILFYIVLYCPILFYMVLYGSILFYIVLYGSILFYIVLYCSILFYIVLYCSILFYIVLYCSILFYIVLYCSILFYIVLYCSMKYRASRKDSLTLRTVLDPLTRARLRCIPKPQRILIWGPWLSWEAEWNKSSSPSRDASSVDMAKAHLTKLHSRFQGLVQGLWREEIAAFHMLIPIKRTCFLENCAQISWTCNLQLAATARLHHQSQISPTCVRRRVSGSESMISEDCWFAWDRVIDWTQDFCVSFFSTWFWGPQAAAAD